MTPQQTKAALEGLRISLDAVKDSGVAGMPAGTLYGALMATGMGLGDYQAMERLMIGTGLVAKRGNILHWQLGEDELERARR
jgi:hypothetical protein